MQSNFNNKYPMKQLTLLLYTFLISTSIYSQSGRVVIDENRDGMKLLVNGEPFMVNGMNWDYFPIGTNFSYNLWNQPDDFIMKALDDEMSLLKIWV